MTGRKSPKYKHFFKIINGKYLWAEPDMFEYKRKVLEGKRGYAIIEEEEEEISPNQYAYYFGGIIRRECMVSEAFQGFTEHEIHEALFFELRSTTKGIKLPDGTTKPIRVSEDFGSYKKKDMSAYIEELIPHLNVNYNIWPKPASHYKYNRFYINPKTL